MSAPISRWIAAPLGPDVEGALDRLAALDDVARVAVMPDVHLADSVCVGCVTATRTTLLPEAVGGDIGCGMLALRFDVTLDALDRHAAARLLHHLGRTIPVAQHPSADAALPAELAERPLSAASLRKLAGTIGRVQLGTLGRGNHFVELQRGDDDGALWLMLHSGSRGIGQAIRDHHRARAEPAAGGLASLSADAPAGRDYLADHAWARDWARASRRLMAERVAAGVADVLGADVDPTSRRECDHNHVVAEEHGGERLWVHRKGALSARAGEPGIIPGSMGSPSHHTSGRGEPTSLCSSSHGAGRALSRGDARRSISSAALERQIAGVWFDRRMADALREEAPAAYTDIGRVMRAQHPLTRIERTLRPLLSFKGG
ncbi:MAG: RtcB family protein [Deltaproteobacteria bacterium]|nr:RtcB family protein [Deltaproteobacteria bacterium]